MPAPARLPYPTIVGFERALRLLIDVTPGVNVDRAFLLERGFARNAVGPILDGLAFVGLLDARGVLSPRVGEFLERPQPIVRAALAPVLARLRPPYADRGGLVGGLVPLAGRDDTTLPLSATFLAWLADLGKIELVVRDGPKPGARPGVPRRRRAARTRRQDAEGNGPSGRPTGPAPASSPGAAVTFQVVVDRNTTPADLERMVRDVEEAMERIRRSAEP